MPLVIWFAFVGLFFYLISPAVLFHDYFSDDSRIYYFHYWNTLPVNPFGNDYIATYIREAQTPIAFKLWNDLLSHYLIPLELSSLNTIFLYLIFFPLVYLLGRELAGRSMGVALTVCFLLCLPYTSILAGANPRALFTLFLLLGFYLVVKENFACLALCLLASAFCSPLAFFQLSIYLFLYCVSRLKDFRRFLPIGCCLALGLTYLLTWSAGVTAKYGKMISVSEALTSPYWAGARNRYNVVLPLDGFDYDLNRNVMGPALQVVHDLIVPRSLTELVFPGDPEKIIFLGFVVTVLAVLLFRETIMIRLSDFAGLARNKIALAIGSVLIAYLIAHLFAFQFYFPDRYLKNGLLPLCLGFIALVYSKSVIEKALTGGRRKWLYLALLLVPLCNMYQFSMKELGYLIETEVARAGIPTEIVDLEEPQRLAIWNDDVSLLLGHPVEFNMETFEIYYSNYADLITEKAKRYLDLLCDPNSKTLMSFSEISDPDLIYLPSSLHRTDTAFADQFPSPLYEHALGCSYL